MEIIVIDSKENSRLIRTYMKDYYDVLNPKYFQKFYQIVVIKKCFKKTHNKHYSLQAIPIRKPDETHKLYNIPENVYQTLLTKMNKFSLTGSKLFNAKHDNLINDGLMITEFRFTNIVEIISQIFRHKYPNNEYFHIEKLILEFLLLK